MSTLIRLSCMGVRAYLLIRAYLRFTPNQSASAQVFRNGQHLQRAARNPTIGADWATGWQQHMATRFDWRRVKATTMVIETVQLGLAVVALGLAWLSFPMLVALLIVELLLITVLSSTFYRDRAAGKHLIDALKMLFACAFCSVFLLAAYAGAGGFVEGVRIAPYEFVVLALLIAARVAMVAVVAWRSSNRRLTWTRESLQRGGVVFIAMFIAAFACFLPGIPLAAALTPFWPDVAADLAVGGMLLLVQAGLACVMSTMTDQELAEISNNPYLD